MILTLFLNQSRMAGKNNVRHSLELCILILHMTPIKPTYFGKDVQRRRELEFSLEVLTI